MIAPGDYRVSRQATTLQSWMMATGMTAVTVLCAQVSVHIPFTPIPLTLQPFAVMLAGLLLGRTWGCVALAQYLLLGAVGAHVFSSGSFGSAALLGFTGGYLISYPIAAGVIGWVSSRNGVNGKAEPDARIQFLACLAGIAVMYGIGASWFAVASHQSSALAVLQGAAVFLAWDVAKACVAVGIAKGIGSFQHGRGW